MSITVNIGERVDVVPIVDGYIVEKGVYRLPYGGRQITEHLTRLLTETGHRLVLLFCFNYYTLLSCFYDSSKRKHIGEVFAAKHSWKVMTNSGGT